MVIIFGKNDKCENLGILTQEEASAYVYFLDAEKVRHENAIDDAEVFIEDMVGFHRPDDNIEPSKLFYQSAIRRHKKDIEGIDVLISSLKGFYGI